MERTLTSSHAIVVNGELRDVLPGATIEAFLRAHDLDPDLVVVERNGAIVPRRDFATTALEHDDALEIVHFVGGG
jgi:thiamine biosynthesis protein ThiS